MTRLVGYGCSFTAGEELLDYTDGQFTPEEQELKEKHSFMWLNLIDRKNDGKSIQRIINLWILKYSNYKKKRFQ